MTNRKERPEKKTADWHASLQTLCVEYRALHPSRRRFLQQLSASLALINSLPLITPRPAQAAATTESGPLSDPWLTLDIVLEHLFPADDESPGARDINALSFMRQMLELPSTEDYEKTFVLNGVTWLNDFTRENYRKPFIELEEDEREKALRRIAASQAGESWLSTLLVNIFEALLSDPVYGGNPDGIGWQWLKHQPGFPRPSKNKRYMDLL